MGFWRRGTTRTKNPAVFDSSIAINELASRLLFRSFRHLNGSSKVCSDAVDFLLRVYFFGDLWNVDLPPSISIGRGKIKKER